MSDDFFTEGTGPLAMAEQDLCIAVGEDLTRHYPGHPWLVGADLLAGSIVIDLGYEKPAAVRNMAYLLHPQTLMSPGGSQRVMQAGGELLERFGLPRGPGTWDAAARAVEHGLDADDTAEGKWALGRMAGL